jgi:streptogramin lyase
VNCREAASGSNGESARRATQALAGVTALCLLATGTTLIPRAVAAVPTATEFSTAPIRPAGITAGPDGNMWFTIDKPISAIGVITPAGAISEFDGLSPGSHPRGIVSGPDGDLWFTEREATPPAIGRITPTGVITEFGLKAGHPEGIAAGADGNVWFTIAGATDAIGRISPAGKVEEFLTGLKPGSEPDDIASGPDGNMWFTDRGTTHAIGRISLGGAIEEFTAGLNPGSEPTAITAGPDGNVWFTDGGKTHAIGRITPGGAIEEFESGLTEFDVPNAIVAGADGDLWFTNAMGNAPDIGRITPSGTISEFPTGQRPNGDNQLHGIAAGPDGNLWFADLENDAIGRINTAVEAPSSGDLLRNPGGELGTPAASEASTVPVLGWAAMANFTTVASSAPAELPAAPSGGAFFAAGPNDASSEAIQDVDVSHHAGEIDAGRATAILSGQLGGFETQEDAASLSARFLDGNYNPLGTVAIAPVSAIDRGGLTGFLTREISASVPVGTRTIQVIASGRRVDGAYDDAYFDNLDLELSIAPAPAGGGSNVAGGSIGASELAVAATIGQEKLSPSTFQAAPSGPSALAAKRKFGTEVSYVLNEAASVRFTVTQAESGRTASGGRCVKPTRANHRAHKCTRVITLNGSFTRVGAAGSNGFRFTGRLAGAKLKPGQYRLVATPSTARRSGRPASASFHIITPAPGLSAGR